MPDALFVYGTLMQGFPLHHLLEGRAEFLGEGQIKARLFSLGGFPGAVEDPRGVVVGEVYQSEEMADLLMPIDAEEEYDPADEAGSLFIRREVPVRLREEGRTVRAWVYFYNGPLSRARPIPSGSWKSFLDVGGERPAG
ncbi:MAG: gamma-glutamylcyclotransferase [Candidatus Rokubacteria bacterium]|nr:gamma-glutamylcyclotransferase [Candidatus Rokubacteria bacterium]